ncbi:MAG: hypothetical protein ACK41T_03180 [Pseudobdellovibrio sp.]
MRLLVAILIICFHVLSRTADYSSIDQADRDIAFNQSGITITAL